jgi:hypothetical protein
VRLAAPRTARGLGARARFARIAGAGLVLLASCERKPRAREREAAAARERAQSEARRHAAQAALPLPEEPPIEISRVPHSGFPCAVDDVLSRKCRRCHTVPTRHGAPFVFLTWEDAQQMRADQPLTALMGRAVRSGFMPYKIDANPKVEPLTEDEKKIILDWIDAGAPRQDCDSSTPVPSASTHSGTLKPKAAASRVKP